MRVGLATLVAGRPEHLRRQAHAVAGLPGIARYVVVSMGQELEAPPGAGVVTVAPGRRGLPLAAARNRAIDALGDCELAVLLDVDCLPSGDLLPRYLECARALEGRPALLCGPVGYLDPLAPDVLGPGAAARRQARGRVIREFPRDGWRRESRAELFWSLSFAVSPRTHRAIGGFDEAYVGYGAEDTDYGLRACAGGAELWFVGGAWAYHQAHPATGEAALPELVANARRFHARWGFWPMGDRLARLAAEGRIAWEPDGSRCEVLSGRQPCM